MTRMLASVADAAEAEIVLQLGADVIDLKDPRRGALGAVPLDAAREALAAVARRRETSAALGDPPYDGACAARESARARGDGRRLRQARRRRRRRLIVSAIPCGGWRATSASSA